MEKVNRRDFFALAAAAGAAGVAGCASGKCCGKQEPGCCGKGRILFGSCRGFEELQMMKDVGYDFFENSAANMFIPGKSEEEWKKQRDRILSQPLPLRSCNGFLPAKFRLTGKNTTWGAALDYAEILCRRADEVGLVDIVFGSGGARNVPHAYYEDGRHDGFPIEEGRDQFIEFNRKLAQRIAGCKVAIVIEPLRQNESNIINYVWQGMQIVNEINSPRIQELADLFHMAMGRESERSLVEAGCHLKHCHIAMPNTRWAPGLSDPGMIKVYMKTLKEMGYTGGVSVEANWLVKGKTEDQKRQDLAKGLELMKQWAGQA